MAVSFVLKESHGHEFTWSNNRVDGYIEERLDRVVANSGWMPLFPTTCVENLVWDGSDHLPIILHFLDIERGVAQNFWEDNRLFRFEVRWVRHEEFNSCMEKL